MITRTQIDALTRLSTDRWPIISVLLHVDKERADSDAPIRLKNLLRQADDSLDARFDQDQTRAIRSDLERIRDTFHGAPQRWPGSLAIFASTPADVWEVYELPKDIPDHVSVDTTAYVDPLIRVLDQLDDICTCVINRGDARIYLGNVGTFAETAVLDAPPLPDEHELGMWGQKRRQRHLQENTQTHFKNVADELLRLLQTRPYRWLVLGGTDDAVAAFTELLHPYVRARLAGSFRAAAGDSVNAVFNASQAIVQGALIAERQTAIDILQSEIASGDLGVGGMEAVMSAIALKNVQALVLDNALHQPGMVCHGCGMLASAGASPAIICASCGGTFEFRDDIVPDVVAAAYRQGAQITVASMPEHQARVQEFAGIGALLRFRLSPSTGP